MLQRVRVKVCGITREEDALAAINAGADALGFVFYKPSPRNISVEVAKLIIERLPPFVTVVALFVDEDSERIREICSALDIGLLQFHGEESLAQCEAHKLPYIKAVRVRSQQDIEHAVSSYPSAQAILVDSYVKGVMGGTGQSFDWSFAEAEFAKPIILAGGLNSSNVRLAINRVQPYAVDVSGGVELAKGLKDKTKIHQFMNEVKRGNQE